MWTRAFTIGVAVLAAGVAVAQQSAPPGTKPGASEELPAKAPAKAPPSAKVTGAGAPAVPHPTELTILIRSTLLAVNQANLTGNYTVLRELGTPNFQRKNNAARLANIFRDLRSRGIDLGPVAVLNAKAVRKPAIDANGLLRLSGYFPSRPERVNFDLAFQMMDGRWQLLGIALNTTPNETPVAATEGTAQPATPQPKSASKPEATKKPTAAATDRTVTPDKKARSEKKASAVVKTYPDVKDRVEELEAGRAPKPKPKPKVHYNPFARF